MYYALILRYQDKGRHFLHASFQKVSIWTSKKDSPNGNSYNWLFKQLQLVSTERQHQEAKGTGFMYVHSKLVMNYQVSGFVPDSCSLAEKDCCRMKTTSPLYSPRSPSADHKFRFAGHLHERSNVRQDAARLLLRVY